MLFGFRCDLFCDCGGIYACWLAFVVWGLVCLCVAGFVLVFDCLFVPNFVYDLYVGFTVNSVVIYIYGDAFVVCFACCLMDFLCDLDCWFGLVYLCLVVFAYCTIRWVSFDC